MEEKVIAAKIFAWWNSWDEKLFAEHAEKGLVYRQYIKSAPEEKLFAFVIGKNDTQFPIRQLIDVDNTPNLSIVLPIDAVNLRVLSLVSFIEAARKAAPKSPRNSDLKITDIFSIEVVGDVGRNKTNGKKYGYAMFNSSDELAAKLQVQVVEKLDKQKKNHMAELFKFSDTEFKKAIRGIFRPIAKRMTFQIVNGDVVKTKGTKNF